MKKRRKVVGKETERGGNVIYSKGKQCRVERGSGGDEGRGGGERGR